MTPREAADEQAPRLPLSALVSSRNEGHLLGRCLDSIAFCDEIVVIDVDSSDDTRRVAEARRARVVWHPYVPIAEAARVTVAPQARHDWLLVVDPDETVPPALADELRQLLPTIPDDVAAVDAPLRYRFGGRELRGTVWGGPNRRRLLVRRGAVELTPTIWGGMRFEDGYRLLQLPFTEETAIAHDWVTGWRQLVEKHRRYLGIEPRHRADGGAITGLKKIARTPWEAFRDSYLAHAGYRDGALGLALSLFWAGFRTAGEIGLLRELRRRGQ